MTDKSETRSQAQAAEIAALLRARTPLLWVTTREEARVEGYLIEAAAAAGYNVRSWDCGQGVCKRNGERESLGSPDPNDVLNVIRDRAKAAYGGDRCAWILRDLPPWLQGPAGMTTCRQVRNLARLLPTIAAPTAQAMIVLSPSKEVPPELSGHATVIDWPLPDRAEIGALLDASIEVLPETDKDGKPVREAARPKNGEREAAIDAAVGLTGEEAQACYSKSLVQLRRVDPVLVAGEKKRIIAKEGVLEWYDPIKGGMDAVGGLENLKAWLLQRRLAYSPKAREYGLPSPKGCLLVGIPGCGKSLTAKAFPTALGIPLLKLDLGALKSKYVGESEGNLRKAFRVIEAIGRCVVWLDEIEKALAGATQGAADGGVSSDALGTILSWMQERQSEAFIIATANDVRSLPPELLRAGRFDSVWFVDLPNEMERAQVLAVSLRTHGRTKLANDTEIPDEVGRLCDGFTGSEIAALVPSAMFRAFADGEREIDADDLRAEVKSVVPLSKTAADKIKALQDWAKRNARNATRADNDSTRTQSRAPVLDI